MSTEGEEKSCGNDAPFIGRGTAGFLEISEFLLCFDVERLKHHQQHEAQCLGLF